MKRSRLKEIHRPYWVFCILRVILVFVPQTGYIHPDEYFQTVEPLAGRIFEYESSLPWEFNVTSPVRSIGVSYFTIGFSYKILKTVDEILRYNFSIPIITPYMLLISPRLLLCLLSFLIDYSLYQICIVNNEKYRSRLLILSSSFVIIIYGTHTFTNTIEMILFSLLLYYISESMIFSNIVIRQREYLNKRYYQTDNPAERAKFHKLLLCLASDSFRNCMQISNLTVLGFFNRPTFLLFAVCPIFFWLYRGIGYKSVTTLEFHLRMFILILNSVAPILFLILIDSFFYGYISWGEIGVLDISIDNFVFPPLNFIRYNLNADNLAIHGIHPRYMHILLNIPLLFNVLGVAAIFGIVDIIQKLIRRKYHLLPTIRSIKGLMTASFIAPLMFFSYIPHQEPRFLIPLIIPLIYLYTKNIYQEPDYIVMKVTGENINNTEIANQRTTKSTNYLFKIWIIFNTIFIIYFGFLHQGGVYPVTSHLSKEINSKTNYDYHIVTSHIYSIPHIFFMQPDRDKLFYSKNSKYQKTKQVFTYEEGSKDLKLLLKELNVMLHDVAKSKRRYKSYLLITATLEDKLNLINTKLRQLNIKSVSRFYPHISGEALPDISELLHMLAIADVKNLKFSAIYDTVFNIMDSLSVVLYEITLKPSEQL